MSEVTINTQAAREVLAQLNVQEQPLFKLFQEDALLSPEPELKEIFGKKDVTKELTKKYFRIIFSEPKFVDKILVHLAGTGIFSKSFKVIPLGQHKEIDIPDFNSKALGTSFEVKIGYVIKGFEISSNKAFKSTLSGLQVYGFDQPVFLQILETYRTGIPRLKDFKEKATQALTLLDGESSKLAQVLTRLNEITTQAAGKEQEVADLTKTIATLTAEATKTTKDISDNKETLKDLSTRVEATSNDLSEKKSDLESVKISLKDENKNLQQLLQKKSFYNETLADHKKETNKNIYLNVFLMTILTVGLAILTKYVLRFYEDTIHQMLVIDSDKKLWAILSIRTAAGAIFLYVFKHGFITLKSIFSKTYHLVTDVRNIEGKLIVARAVAETSLRDPDATPEEQRNFSAAISFAVLKNHFLNMSHESIADDLGVDEDTIVEAMPRLPKKLLMPAKKPVVEVSPTPLN